MISSVSTPLSDFVVLRVCLEGGVGQTNTPLQDLTS